MFYNYILVANIIITSILTGLILVTQIVSYPLFMKINSNIFYEYHKYYRKQISIIVLPVMLSELILTIVLLYLFPNLSHTFILLFTVIIWLSTILIQVPIHNSLITKYNTEKIQHLIISNWIRTLFWLIKLTTLTTLLFTNKF